MQFCLQDKEHPRLSMVVSLAADTSASCSRRPRWHSFERDYLLVGQGLQAAPIASTLQALIKPYSQGPRQGHHHFQQPHISLLPS
jgi:hypothetical protein